MVADESGELADQFRRGGKEHHSFEFLMFSSLYYMSAAVELLTVMSKRPLLRSLHPHGIHQSTTFDGTVQYAATALLECFDAGTRHDTGA